LWNNSALGGGHDTKPPHWKLLEKMGDAVLKIMAMEELPNIFGRENYELLTIILGSEPSLNITKFKVE